MKKLQLLLMSLVLSGFVVGCSSQPTHEELQQEIQQAQADADKANQRIDALESHGGGYSK